jgi:hypothetical protein
VVANTSLLSVVFQQREAKRAGGRLRIHGISQILYGFDTKFCSEVKERDATKLGWTLSDCRREIAIDS